jgi:hypothetical protein
VVFGERLLVRPSEQRQGVGHRRSCPCTSQTILVTRNSSARSSGRRGDRDIRRRSEYTSAATGHVLWLPRLRLRICAVRVSSLPTARLWISGILRGAHIRWSAELWLPRRIWATGLLRSRLPSQPLRTSHRPRFAGLRIPRQSRLGGLVSWSQVWCRAFRLSCRFMSSPKRSVTQNR